VDKQDLLKQLPGVDRVMNLAGGDAALEALPRSVLTNAVRRVIDRLRDRMLDTQTPLPGHETADAEILRQAAAIAECAMRPNLQPVVNGTGVVVHTNLGRSLLAAEAVENVRRISERYSNLEYDLGAGRRGSRHTPVEGLLSEISGAEAAMVVNNNAAAVLLCLDTLARNREVIVSRGELVEIGGAFRVPDVMEKSGAMLREVGTTNRTHLKDYAAAVGENTALLLKVHQSNFSIVGFTKAVSLKELAGLGRPLKIPVMEDLGSGTFVDFSAYGLQKEPTVQESVAAGVDVVTFSGDKLLGGPQAGLIVGRKDIIDRVKTNPLARALRIDKMTLAALESTLRLYRDERRAVAEIPTLAMVTMSPSAVEGRAERLAVRLKAAGGRRIRIEQITGISKAGGGALPLLDLPSRCLAIQVEGRSASAVESQMRANDPPIIGRIENDRFVLDVRTLSENDFATIETATKRVCDQ
jgi:L-seryl-tRNA(Ser) seleniumtransferase